MRVALALVLLLTLAPVPAASAITVEQVVALSQAGVTDTVILAVIDRDKTIFPLGADEIVSLQRAGLSDAVILAMLKSGRDEGDAAARAESAMRTALIMSSILPGPDVVVVGHGPDTPNAAYPGDPYYAPPVNGFIGLPYVPTYGSRRRQTFARPYVAPVEPASNLHSVGTFLPPGGPVIPPVAPEPLAQRALCLAEVNSATSTHPLSYVTACPQVMQPRRRR